MWINFLLPTPTNPLFPGQFVIRNSVFLPGISGKFCSPLWYSLQSQIFPEAYQASSSKKLFPTS